MSSINSPTEIIWTKLHTTSPLLYISWELRWYLKVGNKESNDFRSVWNEKAWWWEKTIKLITRIGTGGKYEGDRDGFKPMFSLKLRYYVSTQRLLIYMTRPDRRENSEFEKIRIFRIDTAFFLSGWLQTQPKKQEICSYYFWFLHEINILLGPLNSKQLQYLWKYRMEIYQQSFRCNKTMPFSDLFLQME